MTRATPTPFRVDIVSLFPEMFAPVFGLSIVGHAVEAGLVDVRYHSPIDRLDGNERVDATPYGGGPGMVVRLEPLAATLDAVLADALPDERRLMVLTSPAGRTFDQAAARRFATYDRIVVVCGRYEGIDERITALYPLEEITIGDFVLTGGEIAAMAMLDATIRLREGAVRAESLVDESFTDGALDYPAYTRPPVFRGVDVPPVLLSGDHAAIARWRRERSRERTIARRPDLGGARG